MQHRATVGFILGRLGAKFRDGGRRTFQSRHNNMTCVDTFVGVVNRLQDPVELAVADCSLLVCWADKEECPV